jgi:hypothetical protein
MPKKHRLLRETSLDAYFERRLTRLGRDLDPPPHSDTLWYLGQMLVRFGDSSALFSYEDGRLSLRPLALLYHDAHAAENRQQRCLILRQLGDLALFVGALFPESYRRKGLQQDYFVGMGTGAYDYLSENESTNRHIFSNLAEMFAPILQLVADCCSGDANLDASDIEKLYAHWLATGSPVAERRLRRLGLVTVDSAPGGLLQ